MNSRFLKNPNLPDSEITLCGVQEDREITEALKKLGIKTISMKSSVLSSEMSCHSDMLMCHTGGKDIFLEPEQTAAAEILKKEGFRVCFSSPAEEIYPGDVKLNIAAAGDFFVYNKKTADENIVSELIKKGKSPFNTNQGYAKCSLCFIRDHAVITDDESIYKLLKKQNFDILMIKKGDIYLSDRHYGFLGGSTGKISENTLAITGSLGYHIDGGKIYDFAKKYGVSIIELTSGRIRDIGGILPLKEADI